MPKRTVEYGSWLKEQLKDPRIADNYLRGVLRDSPEMFPKALRKVAEARGLALSKIAETAGVERESVYRMLSETGNPTWQSLRGIVKALSLRLTLEPEGLSSKTEDEESVPSGDTNKTDVPPSIRQLLRGRPAPGNLLGASFCCQPSASMNRNGYSVSSTPTSTRQAYFRVEGYLESGTITGIGEAAYQNA
jgi:probable addiction module antidote protein